MKRGLTGRLNLPPLLLLAAITVLWYGCGKKAPPFLPDKRLGITVENLTGRWEKGTVRLKGKVRDGHNEMGRVTGCRVYHAWYPLDASPCEGCPISMTEFKTVKGKVVSDAGFNCQVPVTRSKGIWYFQVRLTGTRNSLGPSSDRIRLVIEP